MPFGKSRCETGEEILKVEEIEAIRLKDLANLKQDECAEMMKVSRQTFQRILSEARAKIARALVEGKAIRFGGGDFTRQVCRIFCSNCNKDWEESYENFKASQDNKYRCPNCGSDEIVCCGRKKSGFCSKRCCSEKHSDDTEQP